MYAYTFIRRDIPIAQQIVQVGHSAMEAGSAFKEPGQIPNLVLLDAYDQEHLYEISKYLDSHNIRYHMFYEPDNGMGHSSITTEPLCLERKQLLSEFKLWRAEACAI